MHVIARKSLREFWARHPDSEQALQSWFHEVENAEWKDSSAIRRHYRSASIISAERVVFNIYGNKYRLVVRINYASQTVFIRFIGTHKEYDRIEVDTI